MSEIKINEREFNLFKDLIYQKSGISLSPHKITLVQGRLSKRLRKLQLNSFMDYYDFLQQNPDELYSFIDAISTNVTSFFREPNQWEFLKQNIDNIAQKQKDGKLRIWSAACSSGEEPYSIAIFLHENLQSFRNLDVKILATDISTQILKRAQSSVYNQKAVNSLPKHIMTKYFERKKDDDELTYHIRDELKGMVTFRMFNLVTGNFGIFKNKFDIIFCRNVMIYFDQETQKKLVTNFGKLLDKGSHLFVGHSEALTRNKEEFKLVNSSIYERI